MGTSPESAGGARQQLWGAAPKCSSPRGWSPEPPGRSSLPPHRVGQSQLPGDSGWERGLGASSHPTIQAGQSPEPPAVLHKADGDRRPTGLVALLRFHRSGRGGGDSGGRGPHAPHHPPRARCCPPVRAPRCSVPVQIPVSVPCPDPCRDPRLGDQYRCRSRSQCR